MCLKTGKLHEVADSTDWGGDYKEVETFEQDGHIWISMPDFQDDNEKDDYLEPLCGFKVILMDSSGELSEPYVIGCGKINSLYAKYGLAYKTKAYSIISTGWNKQSAEKVADNDNRPLSPEEEAYAEKMAALKPEPEKAKEFPKTALRDMSDKTFANLLGMGQFVGGGMK